MDTSDFLCPISREVMRDPVLAGDGHSYEREAIERWLVGHRTSPLTGRVMPSNALLPNHRLRALIQDLQSGEAGPPPRGPVVTNLPPEVAIAARAPAPPVDPVL